MVHCWAQDVEQQVQYWSIIKTKVCLVLQYNGHGTYNKIRYQPIEFQFQLKPDARNYCTKNKQTNNVDYRQQRELNIFNTSVQSEHFM